MRPSLLLVSLWFGLSACASSPNVLYKSPNKIDSVKLVKAGKEERGEGLRHPYRLDPEQVRAMLRSLCFNKKVLLAGDIEDRALFQEAHVEFLAPYLMAAFQKATPDQAVAVSFFTQSAKFGLTNDRLTVFRAFARPDGLHFKFSKVYAKLLGDRTTKGPERAIQEAKGRRVSFELQPGQNRISWDPEEIVFDLQYDFVRNIPPPPVKQKEEVRVKMKEGVTAGQPEKPVRERLKELDRLKEDELITEKEYQKKRKELIKEL